MKETMKKFGAWLLAAALAFAGAGVAQAEAVAKIGTAEYETLAAAVAAAEAGDTVSLIVNTTEDVAVNKSITLDLGEATVSGTVETSGNVIIKATTGGIAGGSSSAIKFKSGSLAVNGGNYSSEKDEVLVATPGDLGSYVGTAEFTQLVLKLTGGANFSLANGASSYNVVLSVFGTDLTVENATIANNAVSGYNDAINAQALNIYSKRSEGFWPGTWMYDDSDLLKTIPSKVTVCSGATVTTASDYGTIIEGEGDCAVEVLIKGGTFETAGGHAYILDLDENVGVAVIEGGSFTLTGNSSIITSAKECQIKGGAFDIPGESQYMFCKGVVVSGGTFSHAFDEKYCAEGFALKTDSATGKVVVGEKVDAVAKIGTTEYGTLAAAIAAATAGDTVEIVKADTYSFPSLPKNITLSCCDGVIFNCEGSGSISSVPNGCTVIGGTFNMGQNNYHGWQHAGAMAFENSTFNGKFFGYASLTFTGCHFVQTAEDYCMWTYSSPRIDYINCTFDCKGKAVNVYWEQHVGPTEVTADGCTFNSSKENKPALKINSQWGAFVVATTANNALSGFPRGISGYDDEPNEGDHAYIVTNAEFDEAGKLIGGDANREFPESIVGQYFAADLATVSNTEGATWKIGVKTEDETIITTKPQESKVEVPSEVVTDTEVAQKIEQSTKVEGVKLSATADEGKTSGIVAVVEEAKKDETFAAAVAAAAEVSVKVEVEVKPTEYDNTASKGKVAFQLTPKATVTVGEGDGKLEQVVPVTNDMIDQNQKIAVSIYTGFAPATILHKDGDVLIESFGGEQIVYDEKTGVATVKISHFSTLLASQQEIDPYIEQGYTKVADGFYQNKETYGESTDFYITSKAGLEYFRDFINNLNGEASAYKVSEAGAGFDLTAHRFSGKTINLLADIDLDNETWTPIGINTNPLDGKTEFAGTFDGNDHVISNLKTVSEVKSGNAAKCASGLFGYSQKAFTIKNLTLKNVDITGYTYVGALISTASSEDAKIINCHVKGAISIVATSSFAGCIVGHGYCSVTGCSVEMTSGNGITVNGDGIRIGGIYGYAAKPSISITDCSVSGLAIKLDVNYVVGGIVGSIEGGATVSRCSVENLTIDSKRGPYVGYIVGNLASQDAVSAITDCTVANSTLVGHADKFTENEETYTVQNGDHDCPNAYYVGSGVSVDANGKVMAGTFEYLPDVLVAAGYEKVALGTTPETWVVQEKADPVTICVSSEGGDDDGDGTAEKPFATLAKAVATANSGDTVKLLTDLTGNFALGEAKDISFDLGDKTLTGSVTVSAGSLVLSGAGTITGTVTGATVADGFLMSKYQQDNTATSTEWDYTTPVIRVLSQDDVAVRVTGEGNEEVYYFKSLGEASRSYVRGGQPYVDNQSKVITITMLKGNHGGGLAFKQKDTTVTVDFGGFTYTVDSDQLAGSEGTTTQAAQILKRIAMTFKNGTLVADHPQIKDMIRSYATNMTFDNMVIDGTKMTDPRLTVVCLNGEMHLKNGTKVLAAANTPALSAEYYSSYKAGLLYIDDNTVKISGPLTYDRDSGTIATMLATVKHIKPADYLFELVVPDECEWVDYRDGKKFLDYKKVAQITVDDVTTKYYTLEDAVAAAGDNDVTIVVIGDTTKLTPPEGWEFKTEGGVTKLVKKAAYVAEIFVNGESKGKYETVEAALRDAAKFPGTAENPTIVQLASGIVSDKTFSVSDFSLTYVTVQGSGDHATEIKNTSIQADGGNGVLWKGVTIKNIVFDNSHFRFSTFGVEDLTVDNNVFRNLAYGGTEGGVHFNLGQNGNCCKNLTYVNNVFDTSSGSNIAAINTTADSLSGDITITNNVFKNSAYRSLQLIVNANDGVADNFLITDNWFNGNASAMQITKSGDHSDAVSVTFNYNAVDDDVNISQIIIYNFDLERLTLDVAYNYYLVSPDENPGKFYLGGTTTCTKDNVGPLYPYYANYDKDALEAGTKTVREALYNLVVGDVAQVIKADGTPGEKYGSLQAAVEAVQAGETVQLLADVTLDKVLDIPADKSFTLDLNGKKISNAETGFDWKATNVPTGTPARTMIILRGTMMVCDTTEDANGSIWTDNYSYGTTKALLVANNGSMTLESGTVHGEYAGIYVVGDTSLSQSGAKVVPTLTLNGGVVSGDYGACAKGETAMITVNDGATLRSVNGAALCTNGTQDWYNGGNCRIVVNGGLLESTAGSAVYNPAECIFEIKGGTFIGEETAVSVKGGQVTISGGELIATGSAKEPEATSSDATGTGDALYIEDTYTNHKPIVKVTGGSFKSANNLAVRYFTNKEVSAADHGSITLTGGIYSTAPDATYIAEGYAAENNPDEATKAAYPWKVQEPTVEEQIVINIDPLQEGSTQVPVTVTQELVKEILDKEVSTLSEEEKAQVVAKLEAKSEDGMTGWQKYAAGFSQTDKHPLAPKGQGGEDGKLVLVTSLVTPKKLSVDTGVKVKYILMKGSDVNANTGLPTRWEKFGEPMDTPEFPVEVNKLDPETYWKIEVEYTATKTVEVPVDPAN